MPRFFPYAGVLLGALASLGCAGLREPCLVGMAMVGETCVSQMVYDYSHCIHNTGAGDADRVEGAVGKRIVDDCYELARGEKRAAPPAQPQPKEVQKFAKGCELRVVLRDLSEGARVPFACGGMRPRAKVIINYSVDAQSQDEKWRGDWQASSGQAVAQSSSGPLTGINVDDSGVVQGELSLRDCTLKEASDRKPASQNNKPCKLFGEARITVEDQSR